MSHTQAVWLMVLVALLWSSAGVVTRHLESAARFEVTFWRSLFTALSLLVLLPLFQGRDVFAKLRHAGPTLWLSGFCWAVMFTAFMVALTLTTVANVLITMALGPLFTALVARVVIGHRLALRTWVSIALAGAGIAFMYGTQLTGGGSLMGVWVALLVPVAAAVNWTAVQKSHASGLDIDLVPAVFVGAVLSTLFALPLAMPFQASGKDIAWLGFLGLVQLAIPCALSVICARVLKAPEVSLLALLEVLFGIGLAWAFAGETPNAQVLLGGLLVLGALVGNELFGWRERQV